MFKKSFKALLEKHNLSVTELSKRVNVPKTNIQQWLTGSTPNLVQLNKVAEYFNMSVDELYFGRQLKTLESFVSELKVHEGIYKVSITKLQDTDTEKD
jgi:transcriptional regulator with XRE-family HTH domain